MLDAVVTSKVEGSDELGRRDVAFAAFLLIVLAVPLSQLLLILSTAAIAGECGAISLNSDARWLLGFHCLTMLPLLVGAVYWFWTRSSTVGLRLQFRRSSRRG